MNKKSFRNITPKVISILFAIVMWMYVMGEINPRIDKEFKNIKVQILNYETLEQSGLVLMEPKEVTIDVKLSGRRNDLLGVTTEDIVAKLDLMGYAEGTYKIPIEVKNPDKTELVDFNPKQVILRFDAIIQKQLPVTIKTVGKTANGYSTSQGVTNPNLVLVKGPRSWVNSIAKVIATVDLNDSSKDVITRVPIKAVDDTGKEVTTVELNPNFIDVTVPILKIKEVPIEPQIQGRPLNGFKMTNFIISPRTVKIQGYEETLNNISVIRTEPIDISYSISDITRQVPLVIPEGVELIIDEEIPTIRIEIEEVVRKEFQYDINDVKFLKKAQDLQVDKTSFQDEITVTVEGVKSIVEQLSPESISIYMNLENLKEGEHEVFITTQSPLGTDVIDITPNKAKIIIKKIPDSENNNTTNDNL